jgi:hypothetical protein
MRACERTGKDTQKNTKFHCSQKKRKTLKINLKNQNLNFFNYTVTELTTPRTNGEGKSSDNIA